MFFFSPLQYKNAEQNKRAEPIRERVLELIITEANPRKVRVSSPNGLSDIPDKLLRGLRVAEDNNDLYFIGFLASFDLGDLELRLCAFFDEFLDFLLAQVF